MYNNLRAPGWPVILQSLPFTGKLMKQISHDMNASFIEYSDELSMLRSDGQVSTFDSISNDTKDLMRPYKGTGKEQTESKSAKVEIVTSSSSSSQTESII